MMWKRTRLQLPASFRTVTGSIVAVHPWSSVGHTTPSGRYLSPDNAVTSVVNRLTGLGGNLDIVALLICAPTTEQFIDRLGEFAAVLPLPEIMRLSRLAKNQLTLAVSRMQLPAAAGSGLPMPQQLSVSTTRAVQAVGQIASATLPSASSLAQLGSSLAQFRQQRSQRLADISHAGDTLLQASCESWAFVSTGDVQAARLAMQKFIPQPDTIFSLLLLFAGDDLSTLRACVHEPDNRTRP
ncbi:hypothetical protein [Edwardsiella tarda]|uniref:hypothetical protein n=1 Tax=Edwardsiella tarda TaxID=636 RepID=UPI003F658AC9